MSGEHELAGRPYFMNIWTKTAGVSIFPGYKVNVNTLEHPAAKTISPRETGVCNVRLDRVTVITATLGRSS